MLFMLGAVVVVVAILAALKFNSIYQQIQQFQAPKPAIDVEAEVARRMDWQSRLPAIGTLKAVENLLGRLAGHAAFEGRLERIKMCGDCRVVDMMTSKKPDAIVDLARPR